MDLMSKVHLVYVIRLCGWLVILHQRTQNKPLVIINFDVFFYRNIRKWLYWLKVLAFLNAGYGKRKRIVTCLQFEMHFRILSVYSV